MRSSLRHPFLGTGRRCREYAADPRRQTLVSLRWAEINLGAIRANCDRILAHLPKGSRLLAVVKAGGYGHGALPIARAAIAGGATGLAVATLEEAHGLGRLVDARNVLVMGGLVAGQAREARAGGWGIAVSNRDLAAALADSDEVVPVHLKIDTGMGRFGCPPEEARGLARFIDESPRLRLAGTWTHFACADSDDAMTSAQFDRFTRAIDTFDVDPGQRHACNSAGVLRHPEFALDAVRCGIAIYGCEWPGTQPALALRSVVTHVKTVDAGATIGYGATWKATGKTRVATVSIGYADGVQRARSNRGHVLVRGRRAPLIGVVSMDAITLDVTDVPGVQVGDVATLIGADGDEQITAEDVGDWSNTISYEVLTSIGPRVERRYSE
jgi:alanine racemase